MILPERLRFLTKSYTRTSQDSIVAALCSCRLAHRSLLP
jgi:hypothetical protein